MIYTLFDRMLSWAFDHGLLRAWGRSSKRDTDGTMRVVRRWWTFR